MRKLIGTITIIVVLFLGLFGCEKYNVKPFIVNWFKSEQSTEVKEKANKIKDIILDKGKETVKEQTDSIIEKCSDNVLK